MESMKDLVIQALESKGVLGQIRAHLRSSVFKIVDEQDQQYKMGCGLKWENTRLYQILETKIGQLLSEIIREFMENFKMDYSLSIFIPECGISPERLKKEEILGKLGVNGKNLDMFSNLKLPLLYYIIYYFISNLKNDPESVFDCLSKAQNDIEKKSDEIINNNINNMDEHFPGDIPGSGPDRVENDISGDDVINVVGEKVKDPGETNAYGKDIVNLRKSDNKNEENNNQENNKNQNIDEEIKEEICLGQEFENEKSGENNQHGSSSKNNLTMTESGGFDQSVDSHKLEKYNFVENVQKPDN